MTDINFDLDFDLPKTPSVEDLTTEQLRKELLRVRSENARLKQKRAAGLETFGEDYNRDLFMSIEDAVATFSLKSVDSLALNDVRTIVRLFDMTPAAQYKAEGAKGRGTHLYFRKDFEKILQSIESFVD